jgi:glycosyltransferase involved in cell wall biosynthesis
MATISIIVPVFNTEEYLPECIESILKQSYKDIEILLVDDGSVDSSLTICKKYERRDNRIKVFSKQNSGVSSTRNFGIDNATGKYITFVDSDDIICEDYCARLVEKLNDELSMVIFGLEKVNKNGMKQLIKHRLKKGIYTFADLSNKIIDDGTLSGFTIHSSCAILFRRNEIMDKGIRFNVKVRYNEDGLFNTEYFYKCGKSIYIDYSTPIYTYRYNYKSSTSRADIFSDVYSCSMGIIEEVLLDYKKEGLEVDIISQIKKRNATIALSKMICLATSGDITGRKVKELCKESCFYKTIDILNNKDMVRGKKSLLWAIRFKAHHLVAKILKKIYFKRDSKTNY